MSFVIGRGTDSGTTSGNKGSYKTVRRDPTRRARSFRSRLVMFFSLIAFMTALVMTFVLAYVWEAQFKSYTRENMQRLAQATADELSEQYQEAGEWNSEVLEYARSASAASADVGVQVIDEKEHVIYDDTWALSHRSAASDGSAEGTPTVMPTTADSTVTASVVDGSGKHVGTVRMWAFGSEALITKNDAAFRSNSYKAIAIAALVAVALAAVIAIITSKSLSRPIKRITSTAAQIRSGDLTARTRLTGTDEIGQLGETFDSMATSLERDIKFEHRLTSDVAHELRTPLMAMLVTVEAMQDGVLPADDEHFETVASEVRRLSRLVDAMLHLSRIENNRRQLKLERTDVVYLMKSLVSMQHQLFKARNVHLRFDDKTSRHECYAEIDPDLIREAVTNIMSNALRYTPANGWVIVSVAHERHDALISVRDTGIGIAEEDIPKMFSRFWRSEASRERVKGGLGVGLAITKEIVDQHNGKIVVESEIGKGTTFTLHIPTSQSRSKPQE